MTKRRFHPLRTPGRALARTFAVAPVAGGIALTGPASAAAPDQWAPIEPVSPLEFLMVLVIIPGALFLLITLLSSIGGMIRREHSYQPGLAWRNEPEWFGGPRDGLEKADQLRQVEAAGDAPERGGASGRW